MNHTRHIFVSAVAAYPEFRKLFKQFCDEAAKRLNANPQLPGVAFSPASDGASAQLQALDCTFDIALRYRVIDRCPMGILLVSLPGANREPTRLVHVYFDNLGNVKDSSDGSVALDSLASSAFVELLLDRIVGEYFALLSRMFP